MPSTQSILLAFTLAACGMTESPPVGGDPGPEGPGPSPNPIQVVCDAAGCGGTIGTVNVRGFTEAEARQILVALDALPDALTNLEVEYVRDTTPQAGCADPTKVLPERPCGLAWMNYLEPSGVEVTMQDQLIVERPERIDHVVARTLAAIWFDGRRDATVGAMVSTWNDCHPCTTTPGDRCSALEWGKKMTATGGPLLGYYDDFGETLVAALSEGNHDFFFGDIVWKNRFDQTCDPSPRMTWVTQNIIEPSAAPLNLVAMDALAVCGPNSSATEIDLRTTSAASVDAGINTYDSPTYDVVYKTKKITAGFSYRETLNETGDIPVWVHAFSTAPITASIHSCKCPSGVIRVADAPALPVCP